MSEGFEELIEKGDLSKIEEFLSKLVTTDFGKLVSEDDPVRVQQVFDLLELDLNHIHTEGKETVLHVAVQRKKYKIVEYLLDKDALDVNIHSTTEFGKTALFLACKTENLRMIEMLLTHPKVDPNLGKFDPNWGLYNTPLLRCTRYFPEGVSALLAHPRIDVNLCNTSLNTRFPLQCEIVRYILYGEFFSNLEKFLTHPSIDLNCKDRDGHSAAFWCFGAPDWWTQEDQKLRIKKVMSLLVPNYRLDFCIVDGEGRTIRNKLEEYPEEATEYFDELYNAHWIQTLQTLHTMSGKEK